jgi:polyisoprenoid-binding protein YceI
MKAIFVAVILLVIEQSSTAVGPCVVPGRGHFQVQVGTGGLFGAFAHDHLIEAETITGCVALDSNVLTRSAVRLELPAASIKVVDPKASAKDRAEVQKTMETEVLRTAEFPKITFESTGIERGGGTEQFRVRGNLTIRGKTQPAVIPLSFSRLADGTYRAAGEYRFKQSAFGIKPIQLAAGAVKVRDELRIDFELFLK